MVDTPGATVITDTQLVILYNFTTIAEPISGDKADKVTMVRIHLAKRS